MFTRHMVLVLLSTLTGCNQCPTIRDIEGIKIIDAKSAESCKFLNMVSTISGMGGTSSNSGLIDAREKVLEQAKVLGANSVVFDQPSFAAHGTTHLSGKAYQCL